MELDDLGRGMQTLEHLSRGPVNANELASAIGVDEPTAEGLLAQLAADGYAVQDLPDGRYRGSGQLRQLGLQMVLATDDASRDGAPVPRLDVEDPDRDTLDRLARGLRGAADRDQPPLPEVNDGRGRSSWMD